MNVENEETDRQYVQKDEERQKKYVQENEEPAACIIKSSINSDI